MIENKDDTIKLELQDGKYTIYHQNGENFRCLRYGKPWRNLVGDGMVLALVQEIERLNDLLAMALPKAEDCSKFPSEITNQYRG